MLATLDRLVGHQEQHRADDRADQASEVERLVVPDSKHLREDEEPDEGTGER